MHPKYLDRIGLVALWREGLLARRVLQGLTKGYRNHPQLARFKKYEKPLDLIDAYLYQVYLEACARGYRFSLSKIRVVELHEAVEVTRGQLIYEFNHLIRKLEKRDKAWLERIRGVDPSSIEANPVFRVVEGDVEEWEKSNNKRLKDFT
ncbi:pyrimidine dimer DNA glycosylase/endonuclease V [Thermosphaera chiliense]|uniref:pyrimidine dimer DNA glycosylase/endonuclease V n=1 Tax=Thermosphaera chiliense TaxID=3402707 RepID=UPI001D09CB1D|nr:pyrimidine dimer DNA glycosylase/endonuclease V [Thermosphaera aggregans]